MVQASEISHTIKNSRSYELDFIRFMAAISVLIYHYKSLLVTSLPGSPDFTEHLYAITKFGYLGVDLFFIISGFVIFSSALNRSSFEFAVSRVVRIYPTFWICVTLTTATLLMTHGTGTIDATRYLLNLTLLQEYFDFKDIDGVYWTLVTEIKFYVSIFLLIYFGIIGKHKIWIPVWLVLTILFFLFKQPFFLGWFISPYYSPYFIAGIMFYMAKKEGYDTFKITILLVSLILACIYAYEIIDSFSRHISRSDRFIAVSLVCSFYLLFYLVTTGKFTISKSRSLVIMGGMTYPIYLLHNVLGKEIYYQLNTYLEPFSSVLIITIIVLILSYSVHIYFEKKYSASLKSFLLNINKSR